MPTTLTNRSPHGPPDPACLPAEFRIIEAAASDDFRFEAAAGDGGEEDSAPQLRRFQMTAYTGGRLILAAFPYPVVVDLSGLKVPAKSRPILRDHDAARIVGHTEAIDVNAGSIRLKGVISGSNEHAREVTASGDNGFPWQASIGAAAQRDGVRRSGRERWKSTGGGSPARSTWRGNRRCGRSVSWPSGPTITPSARLVAASERTQRLNLLFQIYH